MLKKGARRRKAKRAGDAEASGTGKPAGTHKNDEFARDAMGRSNKKVWYNGEWVDPIAAAAQDDAKHRGLRTYNDHEVPDYLERITWPERPRGVNNYAGKVPLPQHCLEKELTQEQTRVRGPNGAATGECFQLDKRSPNQTQPVLPTLFMPGFPKSASTWLFECARPRPARRTLLRRLCCLRPLPAATALRRLCMHPFARELISL